MTLWNDVVRPPATAAIWMAPVSAASAAPTYDTVLRNGPDSNRVDIVFLGDGYTADQINTAYVDHVNAMVQNLFHAGEDPLPRYEKFFNVYRINVISQESGADVPPDGIYHDTALDASYYYDGQTDRLLYVNETKTYDALNAALAGSGITPEMKFVTVNDARYGGGGGSFAVFAGANSAAGELALHETGHSFAHLADEYNYGGPVTYLGSEPGQPNVTLSPSGQKWAAWNGYVDPVHASVGAVGAFEGAMYSRHGIYRPTTTSKMQALGQPFNAPSREAFIQEIYALIDPLDSWTDNTSTITNGSQTLTVQPIDPTVIQLEWSVDGKVIPGATQPSFVPSQYIATSGTHTVTVRAFDATDWVRLDRSGLQQTVSWTVQTAAITNHAPTLNSFRTPQLAAILEGDLNNPGTLISSLITSVAPLRLISDVDGGPAGLAVIGAATASGTWQYSLDNGGTWAALGAVSPSQARLLAADAGTRVRFLPATDFSGTVRGALTFRAWDQAFGINGGLGNTALNGGTTAFSTAIGSATITVQFVNQAPVRTAGAVSDLAVAQGAPLVSLGLGAVNYSPAARAVEARQQLTYQITALPPASFGDVLLADGWTKVSVGRSYSLTAIRGLKFRAAFPDPGLTASVAYRVRDNGGTANGGQDALFESLTITSLPGVLQAALVDPAPGGQIDVGILNARKYLDVRFGDEDTVLNTASIFDTLAEFVLEGAAAKAVRINGRPAALGGGLFRYYFTGSFDVGPLTLRFQAGTAADTAGNRLAGGSFSFTTLPVGIT